MGKAGERQEIECDFAGMDRAAEALRDAGGDLTLEAIDMDQRRYDGQQPEHNKDGEGPEDAMAGRRGEGTGFEVVGGEAGVLVVRVVL